MVGPAAVRALILRVWPAALAAYLMVLVAAGRPITDPELWALFRWAAALAAMSLAGSALVGWRWPWQVRLVGSSVAVGALIGRGLWVLTGSPLGSSDRMVAASGYLALATATVALSMAALFVAETRRG